MGPNARPAPELTGSVRFGTGFCLDPVCRLIVTNYHVARLGSPRRIRGQRVINRYLATGPQDRDATIAFERDHDVVPYAVKRDLAMFELRRPIPNHHGLPYRLSDLALGEEVDIYGYPLNSPNPFRHLTRVSARFKAPTTSGLLAFEYDSTGHKRGGASGGIVVDRKSEQVVGVLCETNDTVALAVRVQELMEFVAKVEPFAAAKIFPKLNNFDPAGSDLYSKLAPPLDFNKKYEPQHAGAVEPRPSESDDIRMLRERAQQLADSMRNFIAVQSFWWGSGNKEPTANAAYEVRVVDGFQKFRFYPDGDKELNRPEFPKLNGWSLGSDEWSELPKMVGEEYKLKIQRAKDAEINGQKVRVFQYHADSEDELCPFQPIEDYLFFTISKIVQVACYGEAWVDSDWNIIRISENLELSERKREYRGWYEYRAVLTYGHIKIGDEPARLAPLTTFVEGKNGRKSFWCRGTFSNYRMFGSHSRLVAGTEDAGQAK
jgi:trypsin-like peptidase